VSPGSSLRGVELQRAHLQFADLHGADPNARELVLTRPTLDNHAEWWKLVPADTALILAVKREQLPLIKLLLARGANVNGAGSDGHTPLMEACRKWRLGADRSCAGFKPTSPHILLRSEAGAWAAFDWQREEPNTASGWVQVGLPGYSKSHDHAMLRFRFGPSGHGATGDFFLVKQDGVWRVKWRDFFWRA
jgi:hypothetical protein